MNKLLSSLLFTIFFTGFTFSQDLSNPKGGGVLDIITIIPGDGFSDMTFEGQISGWWKVYVAFKVTSIKF